MNIFEGKKNKIKIFQAKKSTLTVLGCFFLVVIWVDLDIAFIFSIFLLLRQLFFY
jgi:hypothetical protein